LNLFEEREIRFVVELFFGDKMGAHCGCVVDVFEEETLLWCL
jgi:hypothetical protein